MNEKLFIITESLDSGIQEIFPIYAPSELMVTQYILDHRNEIPFFENKSYDNLFTYIIEFIEREHGQSIPDEDINGIFDALENYITAQDLLDIIDESKIEGSDAAGYKMSEFSLESIAVAYSSEIEAVNTVNTVEPEESSGLDDD
jgi:hypothetical protein